MTIALPGRSRRSRNFIVRRQRRCAPSAGEARRAIALAFLAQLVGATVFCACRATPPSRAPAASPGPPETTEACPSVGPGDDPLDRVDGILRDWLEPGGEGLGIPRSARTAGINVELVRAPSAGEAERLRGLGVAPSSPGLATIAFGRVTREALRVLARDPLVCVVRWQSSLDPQPPHER